MRRRSGVRRRRRRPRSGGWPAGGGGGGGGARGAPFCMRIRPGAVFGLPSAADLASSSAFCFRLNSLIIAHARGGRPRAAVDPSEGRPGRPSPAARRGGGGQTGEERRGFGGGGLDLFVGGFATNDLRAVGATASELKAVGFSAHDLKKVGYTAQELLVVRVLRVPRRNYANEVRRPIRPPVLRMKLLGFC